MLDDFGECIFLIYYVANRVYRKNMFSKEEILTREVFWRYDPRADIERLDYSLVDSFDIYIFSEVEEYTYTVANLLVERYPDRKIFFLDKKILYFEELSCKVEYTDDPGIYTNEIFDGKQCLWITSDGIIHGDNPRRGITKSPLECFRNIYNSINVLYSLYWCSVRECFGEKNQDHTILLLDCPGGVAGLVDYIFFTCVYYLIAIHRDWKFVIDFSHKPNQYLLSESDNMWDYFFESLSDMPVSEVYESTSVIRCSVNDIHLWDMTINPYVRCQAINVMKKGMEIIKFNKETRTKIYELMPEILKKDNRVLGVILRGTDYRKEANDMSGRTLLRVANAEKMIKKCKFIMDLYGYEYIFVATEDLEYFEKMKNEFGEKCLFIDQKRGYHDYRLGYRACSDILKIENGKEFGRKYLSVIQSLANCRSLVSNMMNGTTWAVKNLNDSYYEYFEVVEP